MEWAGEAGVQAALVVALLVTAVLCQKPLVGALVAMANLVFGPRDPLAATRDPVKKDPRAFLKCKEKWKQLTKPCKRTGDRYLVVGNGFVGKRLVDHLLERGEKDVVVFDIVENNFWKGDKRVRFVRGDVTNEEQTMEACKGVDTVYSTFAVIKFMERLDHQAGLSYHVNVNGTKNLLKCCVAQGVPRMIVTSSSHATTDQTSEPRLGRDETAPLVTREKSVHHYGWTKAIADRLCLEANGTPLEDGSGGKLAVTVIRPCSAVFGGDDKLTLERIMDMKLALNIQGEAISDWVYVGNVVLGHILGEAALQEGRPGVAGEAFCISNDDATSVVDFFYLVKKHIALLPDARQRERLHFHFLWIPMAPIWLIAYISEATQWLFKGKVSLGHQVDTLTPALLDSLGMTYSYSSQKARDRLGYDTCWDMDEAIQQCLHDYDKKNFATDSGKLL